MHIVQVAPVEESVPPTKYGGIELVLFNLIEELVNRGHQVTLIGTGDSKTSAELISFSDKALRNKYSEEKLAEVRDYYKYRYPFFVVEQLKKLKADIIHNHYDWRMLLASRMIKQPMISTMHGPMSAERSKKVYQEFSSANYISISDNQRKEVPDLNWIGTAYNGIDTNLYKKSEKKEDYFVFLGRTSPEKGLEEICKTIVQTNYKLKIAAKIDPVDQNYFESKIKPYIDNKQITFLGEVAGKEKSTLLSKAKGLLLWLNWEEPFGLVITEAMASGTPVIVNKRGSMPELVVQGKTGFLVNNLLEMKESFDKIETINPTDCIAHVEKQFSVKTMTDTYEQLMQHVLEREG